MPQLKNPRHERFAQELADGANVAAAEQASGLVLKPCEGLTRFYVYALIDPRDGKLFYIGKGKGRRAFHHVAEWRRACVGNPKKYKRIADIVGDGCNVDHRCIADGLSNDAALDLECAFIQAIGRRVLTNWVRGVASQSARLAIEVKEEFRRLVPYCRWKERILPQLLVGPDQSITAEEYEAIGWDIYGNLSTILARSEHRMAREFPSMWKAIRTRRAVVPGHENT